jgi:CRP-like cAMP-binding protein
MYLTQKELLWELEHDFIKQLMEIATHESYGKGAYIFHQGDSADHVYILIKGCVKLKNEPMDQTVYVVSHPGEIFGWSSIVGRSAYSVAAECLDSTMAHKINRGRLISLLNQDKANGMIFYKKVAEMLGNRLIHLYAPASQQAFSVSENTGQLQEIVESL